MRPIGELQEGSFDRRGWTGDQSVGGLGRVAVLALVLPVGGLAEAGGLDDLEAEQRALHPRRGDVDPEQVEHEVLVEPQQLLAGLARRARR